MRRLVRTSTEPQEKEAYDQDVRSSWEREHEDLCLFEHWPSRPVCEEDYLDCYGVEIRL